MAIKSYDDVDLSVSESNQKNSSQVSGDRYSPMLFKKLQQIKLNQENNDLSDGITTRPHCKGGHDKYSKGGGHCKW